MLDTKTLKVKQRDCTTKKVKNKLFFKLFLLTENMCQGDGPSRVQQRSFQRRAIHKRHE